MDVFGCLAQSEPASLRGPGSREPACTETVQNVWLPDQNELGPYGTLFGSYFFSLAQLGCRQFLVLMFKIQLPPNFKIELIAII
jgi:hypothetical protein